MKLNTTILRIIHLTYFEITAYPVPADFFLYLLFHSIFGGVVLGAALQ